MPTRKSSHPELKKSEVIEQIPLACADENAAVAFMEAQRWGEHPECPVCASRDVYKLVKPDGVTRVRYRWRCRGCNDQYTVRRGTVYEESRLPLKHWCYAFWRACTSKKGVSALEIKRHCQISYRTALFLLNRIRHAMATPQPTRLTGTVECDETYVGGKPRRGGPPRKRGRGTPKIPVFAAVARDGDIRRELLPGVSGRILKDAVRRHVHPSARLVTDEFIGYKGLGVEFAGGHSSVNHSHGEYGRGDVHTNTAESSFALFKRGLIGTYHSVSKRHMHRYLSEFDFRWNTRRLSDGDRVTAGLRASIGKRLRRAEMTRSS